MASVTTSPYVHIQIPQFPSTIASSQTSLLHALAPTTPTYVFPAMNTLMYEHPLTAEHLNIVREVIGYHVIGPIGKALACGDIGE
jgi:phosphopantothenoylcysteine decarboxylase